MLLARAALPIALGAVLQAAGPVMLDHQRQLFVDDYRIASSTNLRRVIHPARKHPDNPILLPVKPWEGQYVFLYGTVMRDAEEGIWKAWYLTMNHFRYPQNVFPESTYLCYATSKDGLKWDKPALGVIAYRGSRENNIVFEADHLPEHNVSGILDTVSVIKDENAADRSRRYKMMIWRQNHRLVDGKWILNREEPRPTGYYIAFSADGIRWKEEPKPVWVYDPVRDTMTTMWDPRTGKYVAFVKQTVAGKRARFWSESADFLHWTGPAPMLAADDKDPPEVELYNNTGFYYEGMYLGLLAVFHPAPPENVYLDIQLISSRDGRKWDRVGDRAPFIEIGRRDIDWDFGFHSPSSGPPVRVGDELWFYYSGRSYRHPIPGQGREPNHGAIGLAKSRLDGFVSMRAGAAPGSLTTVPLRFTSPGLYVNASVAAGGSVRAEALDESGNPIPGFSRNDCLPFAGDNVRQQVRWTAHESLAPLAGRTVRLRFHLQQADLYSFSLDAI